MHHLDILSDHKEQRNTSPTLETYCFHGLSPLVLPTFGTLMHLSSSLVKLLYHAIVIDMKNVTRPWASFHPLEHECGKVKILYHQHASLIIPVRHPPSNSPGLLITSQVAAIFSSERVPSVYGESSHLLGFCCLNETQSEKHHLYIIFNHGGWVFYGWPMIAKHNSYNPLLLLLFLLLPLLLLLSFSRIPFIVIKMVVTFPTIVDPLSDSIAVTYKWWASMVCKSHHPWYLHLPLPAIQEGCMQWYPWQQQTHSWGIMDDGFSFFNILNYLAMCSIINVTYMLFVQSVIHGKITSLFAFCNG